MSTRHISAVEARRLLMHAQGLCDDPGRRATVASETDMIRRLGFVQVDTINIIERAHHHIMMSRFDGYRREHLDRIHHEQREIFEHWTHDASMIRIEWLAHWKRRFHQFRNRTDEPKWWVSKIGTGDDRKKLLSHIKRRIRREGPLMSRDFEHDAAEGPGAWWGWKPQKAALDYLWRRGELSIDRRVHFHKVYDLSERVFPDFTSIRMTSPKQYIDWACRTALESLGVATLKEIREFVHAISPKDTRDWCTAAHKRGDIIAVTIDSAGDDPIKHGYALPDLDERIAAVPDPPDRMRIMNPFDPALRDRDRMKRYWDFDYRFEAFVPEPKRTYGYYVLPLLDADELVGRLNAKFERADETLNVLGLWWERKKPTRAQKQRLDDALNRFATQIGARHVRNV